MHKVPALITLVADACHCGLRQGAVAPEGRAAKRNTRPCRYRTVGDTATNGNRGAPWHARATASRYGRNSGCAGRDGNRNRGSRGGRGRLTGATGLASGRCLRPRNVLEICKLALTTRCSSPPSRPVPDPAKSKWSKCSGTAADTAMSSIRQSSRGAPRASHAYVEFSASRRCGTKARACRRASSTPQKRSASSMSCIRHLPRDARQWRPAQQRREDRSVLQEARGECRGIRENVQLASQSKSKLQRARFPESRYRIDSVPAWSSTANTRPTSAWQAASRNLFSSSMSLPRTSTAADAVCRQSHADSCLGQHVLNSARPNGSRHRC